MDRYIALVHDALPKDMEDKFPWDAIRELSRRRKA